MVKTVASAVRTTVEFVIQNQTVKTIRSGAKVLLEATDKAMHIRECYMRMVWLTTWFAALIQQRLPNAVALAVVCNGMPLHSGLSGTAMRA